MTGEKVYLPGLHGIRFLAAFSVFFAHLEQAKQLVGYPGFRLSYSNNLGGDGVSLFFVLSGFLITYLLIHETDQRGRISVWNFYVRRALRIWPLYYFFVFVCFGFLRHVSFLHFPHINMEIEGPYCQLFILYLFLSPHVGPVLHFPLAGFANVLWSVGVEENFYFLWPVLMQKLKKLLPAVIAAAILVPMAVRTYASPRWHLLFMLARFDCMGVGALGAWLYLRHRRLANVFLWGPIHLFGYILVFRHLGANTDYGPLTNVVYSLAYLVVIMNVSLNPKTLLTLESRFFVFMGEISYGFYVYHWLVNAFVINVYRRMGVGIRDDNLRSWLLLIVGFALTTAVASLSYFLLERRFLILKQRFGAISMGPVLATQTKTPAPGLDVPRKPLTRRAA